MNRLVVIPETQGNEKQQSAWNEEGNTAILSKVFLLVCLPDFVFTLLCWY